MKNYLDLLQQVLYTGARQANRTGIDTLSVAGAMLRFDLSEGFPAVTTKKLAFRSVCAELIGFIRGYDNAAQFRELGCKFWDQNANENAVWLASPARRGHDDLGRIYGRQWREWRGADGRSIDQLMDMLKKIHSRPTDRRMLMSAWRPDEFEQMALPPCHVLYQAIVNVEQRELNMCMTMRSADLGLGVPANIASTALLTHMLGHLTGYAPRFLTIFLGDAHIYVNHIDQVKEQLARAPYAPPTLRISDRIPAYRPGDEFKPELIEAFEPSDFSLEGYQHHEALPMAMAV